MGRRRKRRRGRGEEEKKKEEEEEKKKRIITPFLSQRPYSSKSFMKKKSTKNYTNNTRLKHIQGLKHPH